MLIPECNVSIIDVSKQFVGIPTADNSNNKMQQQQHIKRLLSTAAAATGIVGDVDALPAPQTNTQAMHKTERNLWRLEEVQEVLNIMQHMNALEMLNDKSVKSEKVFRSIEEMMHRKGFRKKSHSQIWTKWKFLKSTYMTSRRNRVVPKMIPFEIYETLHKMLGDPVVNAASSNGTSLDGDNSNGEDTKTDDSIKPEQSDNKFGMAHPIFGFRLGLVKTEPTDTGYETTANNSAISEADSNEDTATFLQNYSPNNSMETLMQHEPMEIKEERVTDSPAEPSQSPSLIMPHEVPMEHSLLIPRDTESMSITAIPRTIPIATEEHTTNGIERQALRIAPFAKERNMTEALQCLNQSPATGPAQLLSANDDDKRTALIRKMLRKTDTASNALTADLLSSLQPRPSVLRLPKDVTLQLRTVEPETITPRPKQMSIRQTVYSLRPERLTQDLRDGHTTPTSNSNHKTTNPPYQDIEQPTTSQMAQQQTRSKAKLTTFSKQKKRRLEIPKWQDYYDAPHAAKISRNSPLSQKKGSTTDYENSLNAAMSPNCDRSSPEEPTTSRNAKKSTPQNDTSAMEEKLKELATSLRDAQVEMINNFFDNQMEIAQKEHEFQLKQDAMIMQAFKEQTNKLMAAAEKLFGSSIRDDHSKDAETSEQSLTKELPEKIQKSKKEKSKNLTKKKSLSSVSYKKNIERNIVSNEQIFNGNNEYETPNRDHLNEKNSMQGITRELVENGGKY